MKKFRSVIAAAMAATMVLTMTACDEEVMVSVVERVSGFP